MRRILFAAAALLAALVTFGPAAQAAAPYDGTWKVIFMPPGQEQALLIMKVEHHAAGPKLEIVALPPNFAGATVEAEKSTKEVLCFKFNLPGQPLRIAVHVTKGEKEPKELLGSLEVRGNRTFARLERTDATEVDGRGKRATEAQDYLKAAKLSDAKEKVVALKEFAAKNADSPLAYVANLERMGVLAEEGAAEGDVKAAAEQALAFAGKYGAEMRAAAVGQAAQRLVTSKKAPALAVAYAREAEKALPADATTGQQIAVLKTLRTALKQAKQEEEVKAVGERMAKLDKILDAEFLKDAVPFSTRAYKREGSGSRVALVELFTGAQCPPCVAADVAFDAALKTYQTQDVVLLQYHVHIPGPDPLTNADTEKRFDYYKGRGVPSTYVGGGDDLGIGGFKAQGQGSYERLNQAVRAELKKDGAATIKLTAKQTGDDILISADVTDVKDAGKDAKLRVALVEEIVRYPGNNQQRFHHHVVRAMPGGAEGIALKDAKTRQELKVNLAELKRSLGEYLEQANQRRAFDDDERPLDLAHLMVVAFVQNDETKEVLQAVQVDVHR